MVNIYTRKLISGDARPLDNPLLRRFFGNRFTNLPQKSHASLGSEVIVSNQGYILTNNHVIENADEIEVYLANGTSVQANVVGADPDTDIAVLHIEMTELPAVVIGNPETLQVGDVVLAIGNPFGVGQTVTLGIISATQRNRLGINTFENFIQTDAAINPGNSGGALINAYGELIGINTAIFSRTGGSQGIGFAIPMDLANDVMTQIIEHGHVVRGWLGAELQDLTPQLAEFFGIDRLADVIVAGVVRGGPAADAGIHVGDIIVTLNGKNVTDAKEILDDVARFRPGHKIELGGLRQGKRYTTTAQIAQRSVYRR